MTNTQLDCISCNNNIGQVSNGTQSKLAMTIPSLRQQCLFVMTITMGLCNEKVLN